MLALFPAPHIKLIVITKLKRREQLLPCNENSNNVDVQLDLVLSQENEQFSDQGNVAEAVRCAASVQLVAITR